MKTKLNPFRHPFMPICVSIALSIWSCTDDTTDKGPTPSNPDVNHDEVVDYDPSIGGIFEGDISQEFPADIEPEVTLHTTFRDAETNSVSEGVIRSLPDFGMEDFAEAYELVAADFPQLGKTSNKFAEKVIQRIKTDKANGGRLGRTEDILDTWNKLTPAERVLVLTNPLKAYRSRDAAMKAMQTTTTLFGENGYKTRSDAFRHAYWNWLMSECCSIEWAIAFANAHESTTPNNDDRRMDLNNNMIGRRIYANNKSATAAEAQSALLNYPLLWINESQRNARVGIDYLIYLHPEQSLTVFDDGPSYDDIYDINLNGIHLGTTPAGGSQAFKFSQLVSGEYDLSVFCKLDGTKGGCGFQILLDGGLRLGSGQKQTPQIVIQESTTHPAKLKFPTMNELRID